MVHMICLDKELSHTINRKSQIQANYNEINQEFIYIQENYNIFSNNDYILHTQLILKNNDKSKKIRRYSDKFYLYQ